MEEILNILLNYEGCNLNALYTDIKVTWPKQEIEYKLAICYPTYILQIAKFWLFISFLICVRWEYTIFVVSFCFIFLCTFCTNLDMKDSFSMLFLFQIIAQFE
jgi:hypothetical protein